MEVDVEWNELSFHPTSNREKKGGVYVAYTTGVKEGPGGYFGVQIKAAGGTTIESTQPAKLQKKQCGGVYF